MGRKARTERKNRIKIKSGDHEFHDLHFFVLEISLRKRKKYLIFLSCIRYLHVLQELIRLLR